jgi:PAS domain S-box-containing protein
MKINIIDLIDFERINTLLEGFNKTTGFVTAILDLEGRVLSKSGWRNVCVDFHRVNHLSTKNCHTSDTVLASKMASGEKYHFYNCLNGLVDVAVPVVINGEHIANLFSGQFFFEPPNMTYFTAQARRYGFDETQYLQRVKEVPVVNAEKVKTAMEFLLNMTELVAQMTAQRLEQLQLNESLKQKQLQLEAQNQQLQLAREKAEKSDQMHSSMLRTSMDGFWLLDTQMNILEVSDAYIKMIGYTEKELLTMKVTDVEAKETPEETREHFQNIVTTGFDRFVTKHRRKDGTTFDCEITAQYKPIDEGQIVEFIRDITEQKRVERSLQQSEDRLFKIFHSSPSAIIVSRISDGMFMDMNQAACKIYGYTREEIIGRTSLELDIIDPEERKKLIDALTTYGSLQDCEVIVKSRNQGDRYVLFSMEILTIENELCMLTSMIDISDRKRVEQALVRSEKEFRTLAESMPQIVWVAEPDGLNIYFNHRWVDYTGLSLEEGYGEGWVKPFHPEDQSMARKAWKKALAGKGIYSIECRLRRHDGVYRRWLIRGIPVLDDWGIILKWFGTCTDIEEIKEAEDKIKDQLDELRRWHEVTIDREERILELKREVNALQTAKGLPVRYGRFSNPLDHE